MPIKSECNKQTMDALQYDRCKILELYKKKGYLDKYGGSVLITLFSSIIFFIIFGYFYVNSHLKKIKGNWPEQRCHPMVMPFAGFINAPSGQSSVDYTAENFMGCINSILEKVVGVALMPITYTQGIVHTGIGNMGVGVGGARNIMTYIRTAFEKIVNDIMGKSMNIFLALRRILMKLTAALGKILGTQSIALYIATAAIEAVMAFGFIVILVFLNIIISTLIMALYALTSWFPFNIPLLVIGIVALILSILILIPWQLIVPLVHGVDLKVKQGIEGTACFVGNTRIAMQNGEKPIKDIQLGEILSDGGKVTAIFKLSTHQQDLYNLDNILVTGKHMVYYENKGYIPVSDHPSSLKCQNHSYPYVYCINTTTKKIVIKDHIFLDWDEVDKLDIMKLNFVAKKYLPTSANTGDIHKYMDGGFSSETRIELEDGRSICIKDLVVNDQLRFGERVLGIVEIDATTIKDIKKFIIKGRHFVGGPNIRINDKDLGIHSTLDMVGVQIKKPKKLYHIITDSKFLTVNGIQFFDYNGALEPILWHDTNNSIKPTIF